MFLEDEMPEVTSDVTPEEVVAPETEATEEVVAPETEAPAVDEEVAA